MRTPANDLPEDLGAGRAILLFGLPPGGVCRARPVSRSAVSSYLAVSPLPSPPEWPSGGLFSVALSLSSRTVGVTHHLALGSPDFPPMARGHRRPPGDQAGGTIRRSKCDCYGGLLAAWGWGLCGQFSKLPLTPSARYPMTPASYLPATSLVHSLTPWICTLWGRSCDPKPASLHSYSC